MKFIYNTLYMLPKYKYLKYKEKYLTLKNKIGSGLLRPIPGQSYLYHGTNSIYLPYIKRDGLGKFPDELYSEMKTILEYSLERNPKNLNKIFAKDSPLDTNYSFNNFDEEDKKIYGFFKNQDRIRELGVFDTWMSPNIMIASEYGNTDDGKLGLGEALSMFMNRLLIWMEKNKNDETVKSRYPWYLFENIVNHLNQPNKKQIILAIKITPEIETWKSTHDYYIIKRHIKPEELYIYNPGDIYKGIDPSLKSL